MSEFRFATLTDRQVLALAEAHVNMFNNRIRAAGANTMMARTVNVDECKRYLGIWRSITSKGTHGLVADPPDERGDRRDPTGPRFGGLRGSPQKEPGPAVVTMRPQLREIAERLTEACGKGTGFALFLLTAKNTTSYLSNARRPDVVKLLEVWLARTCVVPGFSGIKPRPRKTKETSQEVDARLALERRCATIGKAIATKTNLCLFIFEYEGVGDNLAYFSNITNPRDGVESWVKHERDKS